jgi:hypothetical protein
MPDRLAELRRLRALLAEHAAWLDREIAAAEGARADPTLPAPAFSPPSPTAPSSSPQPASVSTATADTVVTKATIVASAMTAATAAAPATAPRVSLVSSAATAPSVGSANVDSILEEYRVPPDALRSDVKKGCFLYFALAMIIVIAGTAILWIAFRR